MAQAKEAARFPDSLHLGVVDQAEGPLQDPPPRYLFVNYLAARGPCWARAKAMSLYRGEDWFLQIDSHTDFDQDWDAKLIDQISPLGPKAALTAYPNAFLFTNGGRERQYITRKVMPLVVLEGFKDSYILEFHRNVLETDAMVPAIHVGGCFLFAPGGFVRQFPYDPNLYFHGEEQSMFLRLYTHGWDVYHPPELPIYHQYNVDLTIPRPPHWDAEHEAKRKIKWTERERLSRQRLADLVTGRLTGEYGLGKVRTLADYAAFSGIDYATRTIEPRAYRVQFDAVTVA